MYFISVDTAVKKKDDFNNPKNVTKIKVFSSRKRTDRPLIDQFSKKKGYRGSNVKNLDSK